MKLRCLIIDDEPDAHKLLERYCQKLNFLEVAGHVYDVVGAITYLENETVNFIFLDINLPEITCIEFLGLLQ
jgi:two-component SAPR family response regulator